MRNDREYQICEAISKYLRLFYPNVLFHYDYAGLNLSKAQAGRMKSIQGGKGYPDLFIIEPSKDGTYKGLFIEIKPEGTNLYKKDGIDYANNHLLDQALFLDQLSYRGYRAVFGVGFDNCKRIIDQHLKK